ncbi:hypothetical protein LDENG_00291350 [Lucifuga dentata]|nr:hypothetical protein LDENG_00291350 [Lucifuga dentata]
MDKNLDLIKRMDTAESPHSRWREDSLLGTLIEAIQGLEAVRHSRDLYNETIGGKRCIGGEPGREGGEKIEIGRIRPAGNEKENEGMARGRWSTEEEQKEKECKKKALGMLRELSVFHLTAWRKALRASACMFDDSPAGGNVQQHPSRKGSHGPLESDSGHKHEADDGDNQSSIRTSQSETLVDNESTSASGDGAETGKEVEVEDEVTNERRVSPEAQTDFLEEKEKDRVREDVKEKEETNTKWVTVGLTGQENRSQSDVPDVCFIRAPMGVAEVLKCEVADSLSSLMVSGSEELLSRVVGVKVQDGTNVHFPVTVIVPFRACYRGNYRDIAVKLVDGEKRASYISPLTTEGAYGGQRGSFAEVKVYSLGLFAVVSCLRRESYTVPRGGLSVKLPMDPRICLNYLPGSFTAPVMAQSTIQPVDAVLLATVKSRTDEYHSVVSTSPILYLTHPSSQPLRRPLTLTLPCPPNPEKRKVGQREEPEHHNTPPNASPWDQAGSRRVRTLSVSLKSSKEISDELLVLLGLKDKQWDVLEKVTVRNQQKGLVSFELTENFDRLLVVRLLSLVQPCHLTSLVEELEESVCRHTVTVVLQRHQDNPHTVLVAALPSKDLGWEISKLQAWGFGGLLETSSEISMCEGDQLLLRFAGNITSRGVCGSQNNQDDITSKRITFHTQQKNHLIIHLTEVDPFGNYSSPHYKGTAMFYKVTRGQLEWDGDKCVPTDVKILGDPICKLLLTLPKKVRTVHRPIVARVKLCEERDSLSDSLLLWLSEELSEEEIATLGVSLRLRHSTIQLAKLRAGDNPSAQAFHILALWRRGLPASPQTSKASQLAHCLAKSGRPDLARELLLRQTATTKQDSLK